MTEVPGVIIAGLAMITVVTDQTITADEVMVKSGTEDMTVRIMGTDVTDVNVKTDETGTTDEDPDQTGLTDGDHQMTEGGGRMMTGEGGKMISVEKLKVREAGEETLTEIDGAPLRRRGVEQRQGRGMRRTDAGHSYASKLKQRCLGMIFNNFCC